MEQPGQKRKASSLGDDEGSMVLAKRPKTDSDDKTALAKTDTRNKNEIMKIEKRTSNLKAPIMLLTGHQAEILSAKFSPDGQTVASASFDKQIFLWNVYGECENWGVLRGHKNAVVDLAWDSVDTTKLASASADSTAALWDTITCRRRRRFNVGAMGVPVNSVAVRGDIVWTGSDDGLTRAFDERAHSRAGASIELRHSVSDLLGSAEQARDTNVLSPVTSLSLPAGESHALFTGAVDGLIRVWDTRQTDAPVTVLAGHTEAVTCVRVDPFGSYLLSNSIDRTLRVWDIRPFAPQQRCVKVFSGHMHNFEQQLIKCAWSPDCSMVAAGSSDRLVYVWDTTTRQLLYRLPGHLGAVTEIDFHPKEPIILSCSTDKRIYLGEIEPK
jgi:Prp8 binding protein